ncbi:hypothetical protein DUI87_32938 [Hirundo rustica rustica]|uniref:Uncharacterized protein n=1 Tax=Hirundo rustica rustica TaxID=333673 RepID=A0A3M0IPF4_HIRRU|nr:hypothetical protein DUI87_32938 [Hirundo rustica rustica]
MWRVPDPAPGSNAKRSGRKARACFPSLFQLYHCLRRKCSRRNRGYSREISLSHGGFCSGSLSTRHGRASFSCGREGSVTYSRRPSSCPPLPAPAPYSIPGIPAGYPCDTPGSLAVASGDCGVTSGWDLTGGDASIPLRSSDNTALIPKPDEPGLIPDSDNTGLILNSDNTGLIPSSDKPGLNPDSDNTGFIPDSDNTGLIIRSDKTGLIRSSDKPGLILNSDNTELIPDPKPGAYSRL